MAVLCVNKIVKNMKLKNKIIITKQIISLGAKKLIRIIESSNHKTKSYNLNKSGKAKKLIRTIESSIQKTKFYNLNKSCNNKEILN